MCKIIQFLRLNCDYNTFLGGYLIEKDLVSISVRKKPRNLYRFFKNMNLSVI